MSSKSSWLLVNAPAPNHPIFPLGMAYISAVLKQAGYRVTCLDLSRNPPQEDEVKVAQALVASDAGVIGVGGLSRDFNRMRSAFRSARSVLPDIVTVVGGGGVSSDPEFFAAALDVNYGVVGEGEETVVELADALAAGRLVDDVAGLVFRDQSSAYRRTSDRRGTKDLDTLPIPDYDGFDLNGYLDRQKHYYTWIFNGFEEEPRALPIVFSRSCPFQCTFCYHAISKYRERSLDSVFAEIEHLIERYRVTSLGIYDDLFAVKPERIREFCERIKKIGLPWSCQLRVNLVDHDLLTLMRDAGCIEISYGFESFAEPVLVSMKKKVTAPQIEAAARATYDAGISIQGNFIFGDFAETYETINETLTWWLDNQRFAINLNPLDVYPGAQIYHRAIREKIITDPLDFLEKGCPSVNLTKIPDDELTFLYRAVSVSASASRLPATIIKGAGVIWNGEPRLSATIVCPHCGQTIEYPNLPLRDSKTSCKHCYSRWDIPFTRLVGRDSADTIATPLLREGIEALRQNNLEKAVSFAEQAIQARPKDIDAYHLIGVALLACGQSASALAILQEASRLNPDVSGIHVNLSAAYLAEGWFGWALLHGRHALTLDQNSRQAAHNAQLAYRLARQEDMVRFIPAGSKVPVSELQLCVPELTLSSCITLRSPLRQKDLF